MRKHGLKILGLALMAAVGLMAFSASSALAVNLNLGDEPNTGEPGLFLSGGVERPKGLTTETIAEKVGPSRLIIPGKSAEIVCEEGRITEGTISNEYENWKTSAMKKGAHGHKTVLWLGCKVFQINPTTGALVGELAKCTEELNKELLKILPTNHHITAEWLILIYIHEKILYWILSPLVKSKVQAEEAEKLTLPVTTLKFGGTCSLPETVKVTGSVAIQAPAVDAVKPKMSINSFNEAGKKVQELLGTKLKFGANEAFVEGEGEIELTGSGAGLSWGAM